MEEKVGQLTTTIEEKVGQLTTSIDKLVRGQAELNAAVAHLVRKLEEKLPDNPK